MAHEHRRLSRHSRLPLKAGAGAFALIALGLAFLVFRFQQITTARWLSAVVPSLVVRLTNRERTSDHLPVLKTNPLLAAAAEAKAKDMAARGYFSHDTPEGELPWVWLQRSGYEYEVAGENLAVNYYHSETVTTAWMQSPAHRANILRPDFTEIGIGVARGEYQDAPALFVVQFFGRPKQ